MATKKIKSYKGRQARITRTDSCGTPVYGACAYVTTKGYITVTLSREVEAGDEITTKNADGEFCINEKDADTAKWLNVSIEFCEVDPDTLDITGAADPIVDGSDTIGWADGPEVGDGGFAIELWTRKAGTDACAGGTQEYGFIAVPFIKNGTLAGDQVIKNGAMSVTVEGQAFVDAGVWGFGPHGDNPLRVEFPEDKFRAMVVTQVPPPPVTTGCALLANRNAIEPGDVFEANIDVTASDAPTAATLTALGFIGSGAAWAPGEFFSIGEFDFNWTGLTWDFGPA